MKKYIPIISLALTGITVIGCRQNEVMDEPVVHRIHTVETKRSFSARGQDTIKIERDGDPPIKDTHDWRLFKKSH